MLQVQLSSVVISEGKVATLCQEMEVDKEVGHLDLPPDVVCHDPQSHSSGGESEVSSPTWASTYLTNAGGLGRSDEGELQQCHVKSAVNDNVLL